MRSKIPPALDAVHAFAFKDRRSKELEDFWRADSQFWVNFRMTSWFLTLRETMGRAKLTR
jgi:hypothetical protein